MTDWFIEWITGPALNQRHLRLDKDLDEIVRRCLDIADFTKKEAYLMIDDPLPQFLIHDNYALINKLKYKPSYPKKLFIRKDSNGSEEINLRFREIENLSFYNLPKNELKNKNGALQSDYFLIGDNNIFWGKPGFNEGCFTYNAPLLVKMVKEEIDSLISEKEHVEICV